MKVQDEEKRLLTINQFAEMYGFTRYQVEALIRKKEIRHIRVLNKVMIPPGAFEEFVQRRTVEPCQEQAEGPSVSQIRNEMAPSTSFGLKMAAAGSAAQARKILMKRSCSSQTGSSNDSEKTV
ncbi:MAG: helix-turn-helix domain-containing protein [Terasakiella sp.]|uniref:helix-turn-helix domain-containing protein n=1 Tax=unclassified Terasakiella TaxID=2614952 RepID=UPI003B006813